MAGTIIKIPGIETITKGRTRSAVKLTSVEIEAAVEAPAPREHSRKKIKAKNNVLKPVEKNHCPRKSIIKYYLETDAKSSRNNRQKTKGSRPDGIWSEPEPSCARSIQKETRPDNVRVFKKGLKI